MSDDGCVETYWCGKCPLSFDFCRCLQEDRFEHIDLIVKTRLDGTSWFDALHDYITQDCDSVQIECQSCGGTSLETFAPHCDDCDSTGTEWTHCHCGMETMGGMEGTLQQCYDHTTNLGQGLQPIDVARVIIFLAETATAPYVAGADRDKVIKWAHNEVKFEEYFENREWDEEEDA